MPHFIKDLTVTSVDFPTGGRMDERFSADGGNQAPRITISGVPEEAVELALICHDPDAPLAQGFTHWVVYGISTGTTTLPDESAGYREAPNDTGSTSYFGPQPPSGHGDHHYYFWVYALNTAVEGVPTRAEFLEKYSDNILEQNRLIGVFSR